MIIRNLNLASVTVFPVETDSPLARSREYHTDLRDHRSVFPSDSPEALASHRPALRCPILEVCAKRAAVREEGFSSPTPGGRVVRFPCHQNSGSSVRIIAPCVNRVKCHVPAARRDHSPNSERITGTAVTTLHLRNGGVCVPPQPGPEPRPRLPARLPRLSVGQDSNPGVLYPVSSVFRVTLRILRMLTSGMPPEHGAGHHRTTGGGVGGVRLTELPTGTTSTTGRAERFDGNHEPVPGHTRPGDQDNVPD